MSSKGASSSASTAKHDPTKVPRVPESAPISEHEQRLLNIMREKESARISKYNISNLTMLRFIRGYVADIHPDEKALDTFVKMLNWRDEIKINELLSKQHPKTAEFQKMWMSGLHGMTRDGHPIYVERLGLIEPAKLMKAFTVEEIIQFHIRMMEKVNAEKEALSARTGKQLYKQLVILDLKGLGMSHLSSKFTAPLKTAIGVDQQFYPETLNKLFVTNSGVILKAAWKLVSPFLDPITKTHIFFGEEHISKYADASQLPKFLGGKCKCKDGNCLVEPFVAGDPEPNSSANSTNTANTTPTTLPPRATSSSTLSPNSTPTSARNSASSGPSSSSNNLKSDEKKLNLRSESSAADPDKAISEMSFPGSTSSPDLNGMLEDSEQQIDKEKEESVSNGNGTGNGHANGNSNHATAE